MKAAREGLTLRDWCHKYVDMCSDSIILTVFDTLRSFACSSKNKEYQQEIQMQKKS